MTYGRVNSYGQLFNLCCWPQGTCKNVKKARVAGSCHRVVATSILRRIGKEVSESFVFSVALRDQGLSQLHKPIVGDLFETILAETREVGSPQLDDFVADHGLAAGQVSRPRECLDRAEQLDRLLRQGEGHSGFRPLFPDGALVCILLAKTFVHFCHVPAQSLPTPKAYGAICANFARESSTSLVLSGRTGSCHLVRELFVEGNFFCLWGFIFPDEMRGAADIERLLH